MGLHKENSPPGVLAFLVTPDFILFSLFLFCPHPFYMIEAWAVMLMGFLGPTHLFLLTLMRS